MSFDQGNNTFVVLKTGITTTGYVMTGVTPGVTYQFKIESRNSYGYSTYSGSISLLCAYIPDPPTTVSTSN